MYPLQRPKISFLLRDLIPSELSFNILQRGTKYSDEIDTVIFYEQISKPCIESLVSRMHIVEAYYFDGPMIATSLDTAAKLLQFPTPNPKFFLLNDLEWLRMPQKNYHEIEGIYRNKALNLLCRSNDHKKLVELCWNVRVCGVIDKYDFYNKGFLDTIKNKNISLYKGKINNCNIVKNPLNL